MDGQYSPPHKALALSSEREPLITPASGVMHAGACDPTAILQAVYACSSESDGPDSILKTLDDLAYQDSSIKVLTELWTDVAGKGIVSGLVSDFFANEEAYFFSAVHREAFLDDMKSPVTARFCSPLLVNAICAVRSVSLSRTGRETLNVEELMILHQCFSLNARIMGHLTRENMCEKFLLKSVSLLEREANRISIPTALALYLMFTAYKYIGKDSDGIVFHGMSLRYLKQLNLVERFATLNPNDPTEERERRVISKALWGIWTAECRIANTCEECFSDDPPLVPILFSNGVHQLPNVHILESPHTVLLLSRVLVQNHRHTFVPLLLAQISQSIVEHNVTQRLHRAIGSNDDVATRNNLYSNLMYWTDHLPVEFKVGQNMTFQSCLLALDIVEIAIKILQPLQPELTLPSRGKSAKQTCLSYCRVGIGLIEVFLKSWPAESFVGYKLYVILAYLTSLRHDETAHDLFARACRTMRKCGERMYLYQVLQQRIQVIGQKWEWETPTNACRCFIDSSNICGAEDLSSPFGVGGTDEASISELFGSLKISH